MEIFLGHVSWTIPERCFRKPFTKLGDPTKRRDHQRHAIAEASIECIYHTATSPTT